MRLLSIGLLAAVFMSAVSVETNAQNTPPGLEELPKNVLDTLATGDPDVKIIIYTNNTFSYYYPNAEEHLDRDVYRENWVTNMVFAYRDQSTANLPDIIELELIREYEDFCVPIKGKVFSKYGKRKNRPHNGCDLPLKVGEPIYAAFSGKVRYSQYNSGGFGNLVIIRHENGLETWYAHLSRRNVETNDYVKAGTVIGYGGATGRVSGPHLHFEMRYRDQSFDPEHIFDFQTGEIRYQTFVLEKSYFSIDSKASDTLDEVEDYDQKLLASASGEQISSEDVLNNIAEAQRSEAKTTKPSSDPLYYTVKPGDTLSKIARKYETTVKKLCQLNNISETTIIRDGRKLRVR